MILFFIINCIPGETSEAGDKTASVQAAPDTSNKIPVNINTPDLPEAIEKGDLQALSEMIKKDPDIINNVIKHSDKYYGCTPLVIAVRLNNKKVAELLLKSGASIEKERNSEQTLLHVAAEYNAKDVAELLIKYGEDVNAPGLIAQTPLHTAAIYNSKEAAEILIAHGANLNAGDYFCGCHRSGNTPLHYAVFKGSKDVARLLIEKGGRYKS